MSELVDILITITILTLIILFIWSRVMNQTMKDTIIEIKDIIMSFKEVDSAV